MLHRNFEKVEAAVVAFVTGSGAAAEVVARASIELSINILYILAGDRAPRLIAYFVDYLDDVDKQVARWRKEQTGLPSHAAMIRSRGAERRSAANASLRAFVRSMMGNTRERWPSKIVERFAGLGESMTYRTFYARMSSETHGDAEESLRYVFGRVHTDSKVMEALALGTAWTTRLYVYCATSLFIQVSIRYAESYSLHGMRLHLDAALAK